MFTFSYFVKLRVGRLAGLAAGLLYWDNIVVDFLKQEVGNLLILVDALKRLPLLCKLIHTQSSLTWLWSMFGILFADNVIVVVGAPTKYNICQSCRIFAERQIIADLLRD